MDPKSVQDTPREGSQKRSGAKILPDPSRTPFGGRFWIPGTPFWSRFWSPGTPFWNRLWPLFVSLRGLFRFLPDTLRQSQNAARQHQKVQVAPKPPLLPSTPLPTTSPNPPQEASCDPRRLLQKAGGGGTSPEASSIYLSLQEATRHGRDAPSVQVASEAALQRNICPSVA